MANVTTPKDIIVGVGTSRPPEDKPQDTDTESQEDSK
jgi:hypothetical protein